MKRTIFGFTTLALLAAGSASADIIISQYYEGSSNDKYVELYNSGSTAVDLAAGNYKLSNFNNAIREAWKTNGTPTNILVLTGTIAAGATFVIENTAAANPTYVVANQVGNNGTSHNGDDSVVLWTGATFSTAGVKDAFGATANSFADTSYVRNNNILTGTTADFNASDWTQFTLANVAGAASNANEYLGFHSVVPEPTSLALLGLGGLLVARRRRA